MAEVRGGNVEEWGVGELGSGAVVVVVRVGNVEEGGVGELGSGAVVVVRVGKAEQGSASSVSALRIVETCSCDTRLLSTSTAGKGLVAFRGTGESCRCGTSLLSTSARRGSSASEGMTSMAAKARRAAAPPFEALHWPQRVSWGLLVAWTFCVSYRGQF